jgi:hypothetical protein
LSSIEVIEVSPDISVSTDSAGDAGLMGTSCRAGAGTAARAVEVVQLAEPEAGVAALRAGMVVPKAGAPVVGAAPEIGVAAPEAGAVVTPEVRAAASGSLAGSGAG